MKHFLRRLALASLVLTPLSAIAEDWKPAGPIKLLIGYAAGGSVDTQARLIAQAIEADTGWKIIPEQATGNSGLNLLSALKKEPADGTAIGISISETLSYNLIAAAGSGLSADDFTPLITTAAFQMGLVAMAGGEFDSWEKIKAAGDAGKNIRFGTATTRQGDLAYHLGKASGTDFNIVSVQGGKEIMNGMRAGDLDIGWVAGAQAKSVTQGEMVNIASAIPTPIKESPNAPQITDLGSQFYLDGYFMFIAPGNLEPSARTAIAGAIQRVMSNPETDAYKLVEKTLGGSILILGEELDTLLDKAIKDSHALIKDAAE